MKRKITLIVTGNGTVEILEEEDWVWTEAVIGIALLLSTIFNLTLIGVTTATRHKKHLPQLVTALSFTSAFDSIVNQTLSLIFILDWSDGAPPMFLCRFSTSSSLFALILQFFYVACMSISSLTHKKMFPIFLYIVLPPIISSALAAPPVIMEQTITVHQYIHRNICGITGDNISYSIVLLIVGFGSSLSAIVYFLIVMKCYVFNSEVLLCNNNVESRDHRYVAMLLLICCFTLVPYAVSINVTNFTPLHMLKKVIINSTFSKIVTGNYDVVFTFLRYQFNILSPLITFIFFKEFRKQFRYLFCICRRNSVSSNSLITDCKIDRTSKLVASEHFTPVLFSTTGGLILRMFETESQTKYSYKICDQYYPSESIMQSMVTEVSIKEKEKKSVPKRKIVRFAHYVKEIPPSFTEWDLSDSDESHPPESYIS